MILKEGLSLAASSENKLKDELQALKIASKWLQ